MDSSSESSRPDSRNHRPPPTQPPSAGSGESPEMLRWRADTLMDEIMLGAVDVSAAGPGQGDPAGTAPQTPAPNYTSPEEYDAGDHSLSNGAWQPDSALSQTPDDAPTPPPSPSSDPEEVVAPSPSRPDLQRVEDRYSAPSQEELATQYTNGSSHAPARGEPESAPNGVSDVMAAQVAADPVQEPWQEPATREPGGVYVSAMSVAVGGERRSNLLPRMSGHDVRALRQEIVALQDQVATQLPIGHETSERARHLLEKAHAILETDEFRTAEVEYYLQQVRSILERVQQNYEWSNIYRSRLRIYLIAWTLLSITVLVARFLLGSLFELSFTALFGVPADALLIGHVTPVVGAIFAGSLGGSIGALLNIRRHSRREHGFFDRKFGLRGLVLPIIGALAGGLIYLPFGVLYTLLGVDPTASFVAGSMPMLLAFTYGFAQEAIYGTRD